ncbi:hypothetical protein E2562_016109 [Oryza meyeriana var. granulata]|uniref:Uncharacterized protein n=1 Tax=Oryza meyeriana var. granulata TaxID=110450 RepID=A0A6G1BLH0_9ORYZ|nr:hypothetical protein E2562_016109 [Oryza meyeriana var. granulata]
MESSAPTARPSSTNTIAEHVAGKRPAADPAPLSSCKKLRKGAGSPLGASPPFGGSLATIFSSMPSPPATITITVGGVPSVSPATPRLATVTSESTVVTTVMAAPRDGRATTLSLLPLPPSSPGKK